MLLLPLFPLLFWLSGCSTAQNEITGPNSQSGPERGSLTVRCNYTSSWRTYEKYWCRGANWRHCKILVITTGSEQEVKKDRFSIRDDQEKLMFTVTMQNLRRDDADTYWCGIEKVGYDCMFQVKVTVDPARTTVPTIVPSTSASTTVLTVTKTTAAMEKTSDLPTLSSRNPFSKLSVLLPLVFAVLLLLLVAASLLAWRMLKRQKKDAGLSPEQGLQPLEGELCYANLSLQQPGTSANAFSSAQTKQAEVEYVTMAPFPREEVSYASLSLDILDKEPTYGNTGHIPSRGHGETTEYSSIRRP